MLDENLEPTPNPEDNKGVEPQPNENGSHSVNSHEIEAQAFNELKKKYENEITSLKDENSKLLDAKKKYYDKVLEVDPPSETPEDTRDTQSFNKSFFDNLENCNNLEYAKNMLAIQEARKREGKQSGFLPQSYERPTPTERELYDYDGVLEICLKECVEEANGDPQLFELAWARRVKNTVRK